MPELPEVETVRRQLEPEVTGRRIESVAILDPRWTEPRSPRRLEAGAAGRRIEAVQRRGKYLLLRLEGARTLVMHLRMTGNLLLRPPRAGRDGPGGPVLDLMEAMKLGKPRLYESHPEARFLRAVVRLDDGSELWFTDMRRFGTGALLSDRELERYLGGRVGLEPLSGELTAEALCALAAGRRAPLKSFLLIQEAVAGIGNIYADEALFRARLHPLSPAGSLRLEHCEDLRAGIVASLEAGLTHGGASMDDYRDARGELGSMQDEFLVHRREGRACRRCGETIRRVVLSGRSTYFCPGCQRRLRRRPRRRQLRRAGAAGTAR
jgi:formamidopyrimidine-DNA glycosylase